MPLSQNAPAQISSTVSGSSTAPSAVQYANASLSMRRKPSAKNDLFERVAAIERGLAYFGYAAAERHAFKAFAILERAFSMRPAPETVNSAMRGNAALEATEIGTSACAM